MGESKKQKFMKAALLATALLSGGKVGAVEAYGADNIVVKSGQTVTKNNGDIGNIDMISGNDNTVNINANSNNVNVSGKITIGTTLKEYEDAIKEKRDPQVFSGNKLNISSANNNFVSSDIANEFFIIGNNNNIALNASETNTLQSGRIYGAAKVTVEGNRNDIRGKILLLNDDKIKGTPVDKNNANLSLTARDKNKINEFEVTTASKVYVDGAKGNTIGKIIGRSEARIEVIANEGDNVFSGLNTRIIDGTDPQATKQIDVKIGADIRIGSALKVEAKQGNNISD